MAGSYKHIVDSLGQFRGVELIDNLGDAFEALEECYGMIQMLSGGDSLLIDAARRQYKDGLQGRVNPRTFDEHAHWYRGYGNNPTMRGQDVPGGEDE